MGAPATSFPAFEPAVFSSASLFNGQSLFLQDDVASMRKWRLRGSATPQLAAQPCPHSPSPTVAAAPPQQQQQQQSAHQPAHCPTRAAKLDCAAAGGWHVPIDGANAQHWAAYGHGSANFEPSKCSAAPGHQGSYADAYHAAVHGIAQAAAGKGSEEPPSAAIGRAAAAVEAQHEAGHCRGLDETESGAWQHELMARLDKAVQRLSPVCGQPGAA